MKKYVVLSFLVLLLVSPTVIMAVGSTNKQGQSASVSATGTQVKNQNQVETKNEGEDKELEVKTQENEAESENEDLSQSLTKVSNQMQSLMDSVSTKSPIGDQVKEMAQDQTKLQDQIRIDFDNMASRSAVARFFMGADQKVTQSLEEKLNQNKLMIQKLEELKLKTKNTGELQQLQETIDLMTYQNTSLQNKIETEGKAKGIFGWFFSLFNK